MNIAIDPQLELRLRRRAAAKHMSFDTYVQGLLEHADEDDTQGKTETLFHRRESLHEFFMRSPLRGANLDLERAKDFPRTSDIG